MFMLNLFHGSLPYQKETLYPRCPPPSYVDFYLNKTIAMRWKLCISFFCFVSCTAFTSLIAMAILLTSIAHCKFYSMQP